MVYFGSERLEARQTERAFVFGDVAAEGCLDVNVEDRVAANLIFKNILGYVRIEK